MSGRRFFSHSAKSSCPQSGRLFDVYGGHAGQKCYCSGIYPEFYGAWSAGGGDHLGQYAFPVGKGAAQPFLVDHSDSGGLFGDYTALSDELGELSEEERGEEA